MNLHRVISGGTDCEVSGTNVEAKGSVSRSNITVQWQCSRVLLQKESKASLSLVTAAHGRFTATCGCVALQGMLDTHTRSRCCSWLAGRTGRHPQRRSLRCIRGPAP